MSQNTQTAEFPRLIYADSDTCADLLYESGFAAADPFLWFQINEKRYLLVSSLEYSRAMKQCRPGTEVLCIADLQERFQLRKRPAFSPIDHISVISKAYGVHCWNVPANFPLGLAQKLAKKRIRLVPLTPFSPARVVKSEQEIAWVEEGVRLAETGLYRGEEILRQSKIGADHLLYWQDTVLTAEILRGEIDGAIARAGGIARGTICAAGLQAADPHQVGFGPIPANVPIVMDIFPRCNRTGYFGDLTRTIVKGQASRIVQRAFHAVQLAQQRVLEALKPGIPGKDLHKIVFETYEGLNFQTQTGGGKPPRGYFHGTGHGIGLNIHEAPSLSTTGNIPLEPGHIVTVEPGLYYPEWGGIRLEDVAVLTKNGNRNLTKAPTFLEIP